MGEHPKFSAVEQHQKGPSQGGDPTTAARFRIDHSHIVAVNGVAVDGIIYNYSGYGLIDHVDLLVEGDLQLHFLVRAEYLPVVGLLDLHHCR